MLTLQLADFGAEVIKVEQPGKGDPLRAWRLGKMDLWWREYARNKKSITLNIAEPVGQQLLKRLVGRADVLVENFVPGHLGKWRLSHEQFLEWNPKLVVLSISAWGQDGPYRNRPGFGTLVEAMSGLAAMTGFPDRPPTLPPVPVADMIAGLYGALSAMIAVHFARRTGNGQVVDLALLDSVFSILGPVAAGHSLAGHVALRNGNRSPNSAPRNTYATKDDKWLALSASTPVMAEKLFKLLGLETLLHDERFATNEARVRHGDQVDRIVADALMKFSLEEAMALFVTHGVAGAPVYDVAQLMSDPHARARRIVEDVTDPEIGTYPMHTPVPRFSRTPGRVRTVGPKLGQHNQEVYGDLGLDPEEIQKLQCTGVI